MVRLLLLDSGAYSVWTKGARIELSDYIAYCQKHPDVSYYVNLDVIPGTPTSVRTSPLAVEEACVQGWKNYRRMVRELPRDKVLPVYHRKDNIKWLGKYLDFGVKYIGISPTGNVAASTAARMDWLYPPSSRPVTVTEFGGGNLHWIPNRVGLSQAADSVRRLLFDGAGRPVVKTHGFALTSFDLMRLWQWHSVDSTSWKLSAAWGACYVPQIGRPRDYSKSPNLIYFSPRSPAMGDRYSHVDNTLEGHRGFIVEYLRECGVSLGSHKVVQESAGYRLKKGEIWYDKKKQQRLHVVERGVTNSLEDRLKVNAHYISRANKVLPVDHIYFAGSPMPYSLEFELEKRLFSYHDLYRSSCEKYITGHTQRIKRQRESKR